MRDGRRFLRTEGRNPLRLASALKSHEDVSLQNAKEQYFHVCGHDDVPAKNIEGGAVD